MVARPVARALMVVVDDNAFVIDGSCVFMVQIVAGWIVMVKVVVGNECVIIEAQAESKIGSHHHPVV
jgi:hypothetical protein